MLTYLYLYVLLTTLQISFIKLLFPVAMGSLAYLLFTTKNKGEKDGN